MRLILLLFVISPFVSFGQTVQIKVLDQSLNEPLIGVNVQYGKSRTVTDIAGIFEYTQSSFPDKITISFIGYDDKVVFVYSPSKYPQINISI